MKKKLLLLPVLLLAALLVVTAAAAGGGADDPLISLDYLTSVFAPRAEQAAQDKVDAAGERVYAAAEESWRGAVAAAEAAAGTERASTWRETRLKHGDLLSGVTGTQVMTLAGVVSTQFSSGSVIDVTTGTEIPSGSELTPRHRYLVAEDTAALFTAVSRTAVVEYCGDYHFSFSGTAPDYNAMAAALKTLHLFRGTDTSFGEGFDLELAPTRIEALVMLIRMLGEEDAALRCESPAPFTDITPDYWGRAYVAYAYEKGYTNGVGDGLFGGNRPASALMYVEFILRALGYSDTTHTDISDAVQRARSLDVITEGEQAVLESVDFLRADIVYLSWYALDVPVAQDMQPLYRKLEDMGVFTGAEYRTAKALVTSSRL